jgi:hypothetical protein
VRAVEAVRSVWPNAYVTAATEILPEIREFERLSTATLNAYLQPVVSSYLDRLEKGLEAKGFRRRYPDRAVERRGDVDRHGQALPGADRALRSGGRRDRRHRDRQGRGLRQHHHLRHGRHLVRRVAGR